MCHQLPITSDASSSTSNAPDSASKAEKSRRTSLNSPFTLCASGSVAFLRARLTGLMGRSCHRIPQASLGGWRVSNPRPKTPPQDLVARQQGEQVGIRNLTKDPVARRPTRPQTQVVTLRSSVPAGGPGGSVSDLVGGGVIALVSAARRVGHRSAWRVCSTHV